MINNQIKELILKAGTDVSGKWLSIDNAEKFAELIVKALRDEDIISRYEQALGRYSAENVEELMRQAMIAGFYFGVFSPHPKSETYVDLFQSVLFGDKINKLITEYQKDR